MPLNRKQLAKVHVAKKQLGLSDDEYRTILAEVVGVQSSKDLNNHGFDALMDHFAARGFDDYTRRSPSFGQRAGMASESQVRFIRGLWRTWRGNDQDPAMVEEDDRALAQWLRRTFGISSIRFVDQDTAGRALAALKQMVRRDRPGTLPEPGRRASWRDRFENDPELRAFVEQALRAAQAAGGGFPYGTKAGILREAEARFGSERACTITEVNRFADQLAGNLD